MKQVCGDCFWWIFSICNGEECKKDNGEYCLDDSNENYRNFCDYYLDSTHQAHIEIKNRFKTLFNLFKAEIDGNPIKFDSDIRKGDE